MNDLVYGGPWSECCVLKVQGCHLLLSPVIFFANDQLCYAVLL